jgi:cytochrome c oxidase subunit 2
VEAMNGPRLTGQYDWYLIRQLQNFKAGIRGSDPKDNYGAQMRPMTMTLADEQQVKDVVAYIQTLK